MINCSMVVRSLLDVLRFLHNDFQWRGTNKLGFTSLIVTHHFRFTSYMYSVYFFSGGNKHLFDLFDSICLLANWQFYQIRFSLE